MLSCNVFEMSITSTPTRSGRDVAVPGIDTNDFYDQKHPLALQTHSFSEWPVTPSSSVQDSRRPSLAFTSMSDATHSGPSSIASFSQPATPVHSMADSADNLAHQWHDHASMHSTLSEHMDTACTLAQQPSMCNLPYVPHGLPLSSQDMSMHMSAASPSRRDLWHQQHTSFGPALQQGLADTLYHSVQSLDQQIMPQASMYDNPPHSMPASLEQSVFPNHDMNGRVAPSFHAQPQVIVPSQLGPQDAFHMDQYSEYEQEDNMSRSYGQSFDANMAGPSGWNSVSPQSPMKAYMDMTEEGYVMIKDQIPGASSPSPINNESHSSHSRAQRRASRRAGKSSAAGKVFYESDNGICHIRCEGKPFSMVTDNQGNTHIVTETPRLVKQHRCTEVKADGTVCNSSFDRSEHLKRHMKSHTNERPFPCPLFRCGKRIGRSDNARDHFMTHLRGPGKGRRNLPFSLEALEEAMSEHSDWDEKRMSKMLDCLRKRLVTHHEKLKLKQFCDQRAKMASGTL